VGNKTKTTGGKPHVSPTQIKRGRRSSSAYDFCAARDYLHYLHHRSNGIHTLDRCRGATDRGLRGKVFTIDRTVYIVMSVDRLSPNRSSPCGLRLTEKCKLALREERARSVTIQFIQRLRDALLLVTRVQCTPSRAVFMKINKFCRSKYIGVNEYLYRMV